MENKDCAFGTCEEIDAFIHGKLAYKKDGDELELCPFPDDNANQNLRGFWLRGWKSENHDIRDNLRSIGERVHAYESMCESLSETLTSLKPLLLDIIATRQVDGTGKYGFLSREITFEEWGEIVSLNAEEGNLQVVLGKRKPETVFEKFYSIPE